MGEGPELTAQGSAGCVTLGKSPGHSGLMSRPSDVNHACSPPQPLCAWSRRAQKCFVTAAKGVSCVRTVCSPRGAVTSE